VDAESKRSNASKPSVWSSDAGEFADAPLLKDAIDRSLDELQPWVTWA
jgi:hypothetical protein